MITCAEVEEILAAFALDALDPEERAEIAAHLATCDLHPDLVGLQAVALALPALAPAAEPSPELERRIMAAITGDRPSSTPAPAPELASEPREGEPLPLHTRTASKWRWPAAIAAALALLLVGAAAGAFALRDDGGATVVYVYREGNSWFRAERTGSADAVAVTMSGLERLPDTQRYQLWAIRNEGWLSVGICNTNAEGWWHGDFDFELQPEDRLVLTIEPAPGSPAPTGPPVLGVAD